MEHNGDAAVLTDRGGECDCLEPRKAKMRAQQVTHDGLDTTSDDKRAVILELPLSYVIKSEYALPLQHVLRLYTVGSLLRAWRYPKVQKKIEDVFDTPEQAHNAIATCAAWLGFQTVAAPGPVPAWWRPEDDVVQVMAAR